MKYPEFFNTIETIKLQDDLSSFLGSIEDGLVEFSYLDIVKKLCRDNALYSNKIYYKGDKTRFANQKDRIVLSEIPQFLKDRFRYSVSTSINRVSLYRHLTKTYGAKPICLGE